MASITVVESSAEPNPAVNHPPPIEQLEVIDDGHDHGESEQNIVYPTGPKLWVTITSLCVACFISGLVRTVTFLDPSDV